MLKLSGLLRLRPSASIAVGFLTAALCATSAGAVSLHVKLACSRDYFAYCSQFSPGSPEVRQCMRAAGEKLSTRCVDALVDAGEVSLTEVSRRSTQIRQ